MTELSKKTPPASSNSFSLQKIPQSTQQIFLGILLVCGGIFVGFFFGKRQSEASLTEVWSTSSTKHTRSLLECELPSVSLEGDFKELKDELNKTISQRKTAGDISFAAVYFKDLHRREWFGINEKEKFSPASLIKVPLMMILLQQAEENPQLLEKKIHTGSFDYNRVQNILPDVVLEQNKDYTVRELMERMIAYSDNYAYELLYTLIDEQKLVKLYNDIGIENIREVSKNNPFADYITVEEYSLLFKVLYNTSYLSEMSSEYALSLLTKSTFKKGLAAHIHNVEIAHKFGERKNIETSEAQLHDCGIVFLPNKPYLACIMTKGRDIGRQEDVIATLAKQIHEAVIGR